VTAQDAIRFLAHEAEFCRGKDESEMLCLLHPSVVRALELPKMTGEEAARFRAELRCTLQAQTDFRSDPMPTSVGCS
jgi:hypothetical protein